jgi:hypothetical protein
MFKQKIYSEIMASWNMEIVIQSAMFLNVGRSPLRTTRDNILLKPGKLGESGSRR